MSGSALDLISSCFPPTHSESLWSNCAVEPYDFSDAREEDQQQMAENPERIPEDGKYVFAVVSALGKGTVDDQRDVAQILRALIKKQPNNKKVLVAVGGIPALIAVINGSKDARTIEHAVTSILNVSNTEQIDCHMLACGGLQTLVRVLIIGNSEAKSSAAATMFIMASTIECREKFCQEHAIPPLLKLLETDDVRGRKDAALALYQLSLCVSGIKQIVSLGGVYKLLNCISDGQERISEKAAAVLANIAKHPDGRWELMAGRAVPALVEVLNGDVNRAKEDIIGALVSLASSSTEACEALSKLNCRPALVDMAETGSERGQFKSNALVRILDRWEAKDFRGRNLEDGNGPAWR